MARNKAHAEQIKSWKKANPEIVREQNRRAQTAWRNRQQALKADALRQEWAERDSGGQTI